MPRAQISRAELNYRALATDHLMADLGRRAASGGKDAGSGNMMRDPIGIAGLVTERGIRRLVPSRLPPVLVASMGRSGSTLLYQALVRGMARARFGSALWLPRRLCTDSAFDLGSARFQPGVVYKTHGFPGEVRPHPQLRGVFVFSSASEAAISVLACMDTYGRPWVQQHLHHLRASGPVEEIVVRDVLRFGDQLDTWLGGSAAFPVLALRYEALWDNIDALAQFVGFPVILPTRRPRESASMVDDETKARVRRVYAELDARIAQMPDLLVIHGACNSEFT